MMIDGAILFIFYSTVWFGTQMVLFPLISHTSYIEQDFSEYKFKFDPVIEIPQKGWYFNSGLVNVTYNLICVRLRIISNTETYNQIVSKSPPFLGDLSKKS